MILVMYNAEQDAVRFYDTVAREWEDMIYVMFVRGGSLSTLIEWGWELIGEL